MNHLMTRDSFKRASETGFELRSADELHSARARLRSRDTADALAIIDGRTLVRECFVRSLETSNPNIAVRGYTSVDEWRASPKLPVPTAVLLNIAAHLASDPTTGCEIARLAAEAQPIPVIVLAESEDLREMIAALDRGARGYIPASVGVDAIVEATRLALTGGVFLPAASVLSMRNAIMKTEAATGLDKAQFTSRQSAVAGELRQGKPNKIIAYQLQISESTVKTHIRTIMKKLKVANRTEAAFKLNLICGTN